MKRKDFDQLNRALERELAIIAELLPGELDRGLSLYGMPGRIIGETDQEIRLRLSDKARSKLAPAPAKAPDPEVTLKALRAQEEYHDEIAKAVLVNGVRYEPPPPAQDTPEVIEGASPALRWAHKPEDFFLGEGCVFCGGPSKFDVGFMFERWICFYGTGTVVDVPPGLTRLQRRAWAEKVITAITGMGWMP